MDNLLNSLSLNNLYRHFLPGALLVYYFAWRSDKVSKLLSNDLLGWSVFLLASFGVGAFLYLFYRGILHPWWCVFQSKRRNNPAFEIYRKLASELNLPLDSQSTYANLRHSQVILGNFFAQEKFKYWQEKNEFRISSVHFLYLIATSSILIGVFEILIYLCYLCYSISCSAPGFTNWFVFEFTKWPNPISVLILFDILIFGLSALIVGEYYDRTADICEGQFLAANIIVYNIYLAETYGTKPADLTKISLSDRFKLLQLK